MSVTCPTCNASMKPLFNTQLFCPNDCDLKAKEKKESSGWALMEKSPFYWMLLRPEDVEIPDDAELYDNWRPGYVPGKETLESTVRYHDNGGVRYQITSETRERRKSGYLKNCCLLLFKRK